MGKYLLLERLASGGMAEVYRAKASGAGGFEKQLAVKRILPNYSQNDEFRKMFEYEARLSSQLTHANIVQIYDFVKSGDMYLLAMEFVDGKNLRQFINKAKKLNTPLPISFSVFIVNETTRGLEYAHKKKDELTGRPLNIIHRDMSPQNIMLSYEGAVKIVDFGIAKAKDRADETRSGVIKGKFGYMSPEQANGEAVDRRSDVFSTVIILWEMLTGRRLFTADNDLATLKMIQDCVITPPSKYNPRVVPDLERILMKGLSKDLKLRHQDAAAVNRDLQAFLAKFYPSYGQKEVSDLIHRVFSEEIVAEKKRLEESLRQSVPFSQGTTAEDLSSESEPSDEDPTRSETGSDTVVTNANEQILKETPYPALEKEHTLMEFDPSAESLEVSMTALEEAPSEKPPPQPPSTLVAANAKSAATGQPRPAQSKEDRTGASGEELVTPSPYGTQASSTERASQISAPTLPRNQARSQTGSVTTHVSSKQIVADPEVLLPGESGKTDQRGLSKIKATDLSIRGEDTGITGAKQKPEDTKHPSEITGSFGFEKPLTSHPPSPKRKTADRNVYREDRFGEPRRHSRWGVTLTLISLILLLAGGWMFYQKGGVPKFVAMLSERKPAKGVESPEPRSGSSGNSFKAPTSTADEKARNSDQCVLDVDSDPRGAEIVVGNRGVRGNTPTTILVPCGTSTNITLQLKDHQVISENIFTKDRTLKIYKTLKKIPMGIIRLFLSQNANIYVNGQLQKYVSANEPFEISLRAKRGYHFQFKNDVLGINTARDLDAEEETVNEQKIRLEENTTRKKK
jgi:serine/threonine protein kinase